MLSRRHLNPSSTKTHFLTVASSCLRGGHRNLTNPWCFGPQGLPTTLNISTNMVLYPAIASSLCNLAISDSSQNIVKNYSIRVSTKIQPHFQPKSSRIHNHEAYGDLIWHIDFNLSTNSARPRLSRVSQLQLNFEILVLETGIFEENLSF